MVHDKHSTFAVTVRPRDGVTDDMCRKVTAWCNTRSKYCKVITEKEGSERHIHLFMVTQTPMQTATLRRSLLSLLKDDLSETERDVQRNGVKTAFNPDWLAYLDKGDSTKVLYSNLPEVAHLESYFPPKVDNTGKQKSLSFYEKLEKLWYEHGSPGCEISPPLMRDFLFNMMYNKRLIAVLRDDRTICQVSKHLARFINRAQYSHLEVPPFEKDL